jgi:hypothetical protein
MRRPPAAVFLVFGVIAGAAGAYWYARLPVSTSIPTITASSVAARFDDCYLTAHLSEIFSFAGQVQFLLALQRGSQSKHHCGNPNLSVSLRVTQLAHCLLVTPRNRIQRWFAELGRNLSNCLCYSRYPRNGRAQNGLCLRAEPHRPPRLCPTSQVLPFSWHATGNIVAATVLWIIGGKHCAEARRRIAENPIDACSAISRAIQY